MLVNVLYVVGESRCEEAYEGDYYPSFYYDANDCATTFSNELTCDGTLINFEMYDTWGDGWNGACFTIKNLACSSCEVEQGTLSFGYEGTQPVCIHCDAPARNQPLVAAFIPAQLEPLGRTVARPQLNTAHEHTYPGPDVFFNHPTERRPLEPTIHGAPGSPDHLSYVAALSDPDVDTNARSILRSHVEAGFTDLAAVACSDKQPHKVANHHAHGRADRLTDFAAVASADEQPHEVTSQHTHIRVDRLTDLVAVDTTDEQPHEVTNRHAHIRADRFTDLAAFACSDKQSLKFANHHAHSRAD
ncbi:hypothetical protein CTAYLR_001072 [Chrysophaeum taylorii]|uniref:Uncharacterized protein n=1 Tax=Chrysophaeum taylorii TaxID=2483200 RepID=A0AAD7UGC1_9STRA|nr:hypothetical protein CTAYLR_001072 [Chrysophaeum taylorii]